MNAIDIFSVVVGIIVFLVAFGIVFTLGLYIGHVHTKRMVMNLMRVELEKHNKGGQE